MLNVIALRPGGNKQLDKKTAKQPLPRHHILVNVTQQNSGRLYCEEESEFETQPVEIYSGR